MLTNWKTISQSIKRLREAEEALEEGEAGLTKKELLKLTRQRDKLERALGGIKEMGGLPDVLFVIDTNKEHISVAEAKVLSIPVIAILDSNSDPDGITHPVPGNDDAIRAISLYCELISGAVLAGIQVEVEASSEDAGEAPDGPVESLPAADAPASAEPAAPAAPAEAVAPPETPEAPAEAAPAEAAPAEAAPTEAAAPPETPEKPAEAAAPAEAPAEAEKDAKTGE